VSVQILKGDCRDVLRTLPAESVHCCVTSPPYWGLRDYGIPPSIWGADPDCEHVWGETISVNATNHTTKARWNHTRNGRDELQPVEKRVSWLRTEVKQGSFCQGCGAWAGAFGLEPTYQLYVEHAVEVFNEVHRVLRPDGTLWLNLGDSYASNWPCNRRNEIGSGSLPNGKREARPPRLGGLKDKDLVGIPWRVAFALQDAGWWLRQDIIWAKPNPMPESVTDRCTKAHEYLFLLAKSGRYYFDAPAIAEASSTGDIRKPYAPGQVDERGDGHDRGGGKPRKSGNKERKPAGLRGVPGASTTDANGGVAGSVPWEGTTRNKRSVWTVNTQPFPEAHFATFPAALVEPCIKAGAVAGGMVLDPFGGAGTVGMVADRLGRDAILIELNPEYAAMAERRINADGGMFSTVTG
jgi:DNA modification methylase